jgi:hypothetical protein
MQAILTSYRGATDAHDSRIIASCGAKRMALSWDYELDTAQNHTRAALKLAESLGWLDNRALASGSLPKGAYCHVLVSSACLTPEQMRTTGLVGP